ncbi:conserved Plasmodium protein, unknown function [Plasmodium knowlesi strain H]|uniref:Uncharacterized protein n=3 Tax=Plasmodium knowlesi TaxID=5850 RepID=A0A5K1U6P2_PLAKH|nr:conserved protein, unknown function [Plasmodium knowlesi strain H]OTN65445.1 Uncharacterized protein PKNOH_S110093300 [Plasmodium knowlesi]CAA9989552.1 conserved protein, unknown function [Plasmodium knowlesi strain H]SBO22574.1 conserved Plasmodium protein, unknown function [Plasmodium knowlesi strain H]SBO23529.1 conserved Plasmodium protein, unknown function [Plasmodium knowlesi strain H]VVS79026.1 conserved protein, unknown function [Plasmodium knowlesi strain H]|eukprot:XP_002260277.1 hypothetical protein, conserved in Plasmodium species [Plasmodium knowlesi strain H]
MNFLRSRKGGGEGESTSNTPDGEKEEKKKNFLIVAFNYVKYILDNKVKSKYKYSFFMGLFIIFLIFNGFFQMLQEFYHTYFYKFKYIDVSDTDKLKEIFFSNKPYLVYCKNDKQDIIHPAINASRSSFPDILNIAIINCKSLLPSKQTVYERFSMDPNTKAFIVCYGRKPKAITLTIMDNKKKLVSFVREALIFSVPFFSKFPQFQTKCLNKNKKCILFISGIHMTNTSIKYNYINDIFVNNKYFDVSPMIIDNRKFLVKLSDEVFSSYNKKRDIHVLCLFNENEAEVDNYYGYFYNDDFEEFNKLSSFVANCMKASSKSSEVVKLSAVPQIKYRTGKKK